MLKKIESIRKKPKEVRNRYAFWYSFGFTAVIAAFWLASVPSQLEGLTSSVPKTEDEKVQGGFSRSWEDLRASISGGIDTFNKSKEDTTLQEEGSVQKDNIIDFATFFSSTSEPVRKQVSPAKQVLIGTSSPSSLSTSSSEEY